MLSHLCRILNVQATYFLETKNQEDLSLTEYNMIKKYRDLDDHGKKNGGFYIGKRVGKK